MTSNTRPPAAKRVLGYTNFKTCPEHNRTPLEVLLDTNDNALIHRTVGKLESHGCDEDASLVKAWFEIANGQMTWVKKTREQHEALTLRAAELASEAKVWRWLALGLFCCLLVGMVMGRM